MAKVNVNFFLGAMGLDFLTESEMRRDLLEEERDFFGGISSDRLSKDSDSYILTFQEEIKDDQEIKRDHRLSFVVQKDKIVAHYVLIEHVRQVFRTLDLMKPVSRYRTCQTDVIAEFMPLEEEGLVVYEVGRMQQEMVEDENRGIHGFIRPILSLNDISLDQRNLSIRDFASLEMGEQKKMKI